MAKKQTPKRLTAKPNVRTQQMVYKKQQNKYEKIRAAIRSNLVILNSNIIILEEVLRYKKILYSNFGGEFIWVVVENCFSNSVLIINRIWVPMGGRTDCVLRYWLWFTVKNLKKEYRHLWIGRFDRLAKDEREFEKNLRKLKAIRNKRLAHLDLEAIAGRTKKKSSKGRRNELRDLSLAMEELLLDELKEAFGFLSEYFRRLDPLVFTQMRNPLGTPYMRDDVIHVFDMISLNTAVVKEYRIDPRNWNGKYANQYAGPDVKKLIQEIHERNPN